MAYKHSFWVSLFFVLELFFPTDSLFSQTDVVFKGVLFSSTEKERVSYASISILFKPIGVVSNEQGEFKLHIPSEYSNDSVVVTCLGYQTFKKKVSDIKNDFIDTIKLVTEVTSISEIVITADLNKSLADKIVKNAIRLIPVNYNTKPFIIGGYYREYIKKNNEFLNLLEAAVDIEDPGFGKKDYENSKIRLLQCRKNESHRIDSSKFITYDNYVHKYIPGAYINPMGGNELSILRSHDPIRNYNRFSMSFINNFSKWFVRNHLLKIDSISLFDDKSIYCISFNTGYRIADFVGDIYRVSGNMLIRTDNQSIIRMTYALFASTDEGELKLYEMKVEYKEYRKKMYLNYLLFENYFETSFKKVTQAHYQYREFFVNNILPDRFKPIPPEEEIPKKSPLFENKTGNDPNFWKHYNHFLSKPLVEE
jgi:hypothetical protein